MSVSDLFSEKSDLYAAARPHYPRSLYEFLAACIETKKRVWDCGTGNGQAAIALAEYFSEVQATDLSAQQITNAIPVTNVRYSVQPAEATNFPDTYFDAVIVAQALHWFDLDRFWVEVNRVLRRRGVFAAWGYTFFTISPDIDAVVKTSLFDLIEPYWSPRVHLLWDGYREVGCPFASITVPPIEMKVLWNLPELLAYLHTWSATRQRMQEKGSDFFEVVRDRLSSIWGSSAERKAVTMTLHAIAGRKEH
jgi:SAM-dependent methyltransferase